MAQSGKDFHLSFTKVADDFEDLVMLVYHDAAWANAAVDPALANEQDLKESAGVGVYSQLGHIMLMTSNKALEGETCPTVVMGWKSHACPRVCRSTFAAEVMSGLEGWEDALAMRAFLYMALRGSDTKPTEEKARELFPIVSLTDCKSVYDNAFRAGGPRAPTEKRLIIDLIALRKMVFDEAKHWGTKIHGGKALRWLPTNHQLADQLTKVITDVKKWWEAIQHVKLPFPRSNSTE